MGPWGPAWLPCAPCQQCLAAGCARVAFHLLVLILASRNSLSWQSGGVSIPAMKMVNPASRLKQSQQGSPDKSKHIKQRMEYMRIQGQQQVAYL